MTKFFGNQQKGFFVDIGAYHPQQYSNTYLLYKKGWRGINIDPRPGSKALFDKLRPEDINLEIAVLNGAKKLEYHIFTEPALNTFDTTLLQERKKNHRYLKSELIGGQPLSDLLEKNLPANVSEIDLINVDAEGLDLEILKSNDWQRFRPKLIMVEVINTSLQTVIEDPLYKHLFNHEYLIYGKTVQTVFFIEKNYYKKRYGSIESTEN